MKPNTLRDNKLPQFAKMPGCEGQDVISSSCLLVLFIYNSYFSFALSFLLSDFSSIAFFLHTRCCSSLSIFLHFPHTVLSPLSFIPSLYSDTRPSVTHAAFSPVYVQASRNNHLQLPARGPVSSHTPTLTSNPICIVSSTKLQATHKLNIYSAYKNYSTYAKLIMTILNKYNFIYN